MVGSGVRGSSKARSLLWLSLAAALACASDERPPPEAPELHETPTDTAALVEARYFTVPLGQSVVQAEERAKMLADLARQPGSNFGEIARHYTDNPAETIRFRRGHVTDAQAAMAEATFALRVGQVSEPVRVPAGFVILLREPNPQEGPSQVGARHILIMHVDSDRAPDTVTRTRAEALALATRIAEEAQNGGDWSTLHSENTDEPGSPPNGDLGTFERGAMVPAFERAVWGMAIGAISDPVETPFGFHVIQRTQ